MSDRITLAQPNPIISQNIAEFSTPKRMFREDKPIVVLPDSALRQDKTCLGTVGYVNEDYLYPFQLFGDMGCGVAALIIDEDVELPDNLPELIKQVMDELYFEPTEESDLGIDLSVYTGDFDEIESTIAEKVFALRDSGDDDVYLTSSVIGGSEAILDPGIATMSLSESPEAGGGRDSQLQEQQLRREGEYHPESLPLEQRNRTIQSLRRIALFPR